MNRGSEWRKWDLHIHTPETAKNNLFGDPLTAWEEYIQSLEKTDIAVFGITDYFSITNYLKVKEYQKKYNRLEGKYILPNVEMRIEPVTAKGTPINIHAIFDPTLTEEELNREFFRALKFKYKDSEYSCLAEDLRTLGRILENNQSYPENAAIKRAIGEFIISYTTLRDVVEKPFFKNRIIIAVSNSSNDGSSGLQKHEGGLQAARCEIVRMADIILSGNPNDIDYFLGKRTSVKEVIETYGSLKPCIMGSDAHSLDAIGMFPNNRVTWLKADPTFEGLKQILFEPEERVQISEIKPDPKYDYNVIDYVELNTAGTWHQKIALNQNLNTIIGGRSTGKSTLLASIAAKFEDVSEVENSSYISQLGDNVHVYWKDGQENSNKGIEYFPQNYISKVSDTQYMDSLLLKILLDNPEKKSQYDIYKSNLALQFTTIQSKVALFFEKRRLYFEKNQAIKTLGDVEGIKREISKLQNTRNEIQSKLVDKKDIIDAYEKTEIELTKLKNQELRYKKDIENLLLLSSQSFVVSNNSLSLSGLSQEYINNITKEIKQATDNANQYIQNKIRLLIIDVKNELQKITSGIQQIQDSQDYKNGKQIFDANKSLMEIIQTLASLNQKQTSIEKEMEVAKELNREYVQLGQELLNLHIGYLDIMNDIASNMRTLHEDVKLSSEIVLKPNLESTLTECISLRSSAMTELIENVIKEYKKKTKHEVRECIKGLLNSALKNELSFKGGYDSHSFISKILSECWFDIRLNVEYDGDNLKDMSPGKRSFVVLKLLLDFSDKKCPILIDQPEDNLDNRAIYNELVKYIRKKKKERQIILVTHNPNIVVGADSEEVIVANQDGKNSPNTDGIKFQYITGSLENSSPYSNDSDKPLLLRCGIREHVCDILEGGEIAFRDRENKYGFHKI